MEIPRVGECGIPAAARALGGQRDNSVGVGGTLGGGVEDDPPPVDAPMSATRRAPVRRRSRATARTSSSLAAPT
jgi:hypothetical protein